MTFYEIVTRKKLAFCKNIDKRKRDCLSVCTVDVKEMDKRKKSIKYYFESFSVNSELQF